MKQCAHKILALAVMTMLLSGSSFAQDITKISNSHKSDFSLARDWKFYKKWVVASDRLGEFCTSLSTMTLGAETLLPDGTWTKSHTDQNVVWYFGVMPASSILSVLSNYCQ